MKHSLIILLFITIIGCNSNDLSLPMYDGAGNSRIEEAFIPITESLNPSESEIQIQSQIDNKERKIIKNGFVKIKSDDINESKDFLNSIISKFDCYTSSESFEDQNSRLAYNLTVRILHSQFDNFLLAIEQGNDRVSEKSIFTSDVTEQFFDLKSRLENNQEIEKRFLDLLDKASSVKDILDIERSLGEIRGEIESQQGRLNRLNNQIVYSTLDIYVSQSKTIKESGADRDPFFRTVGISLKQGWIGFIEFIIVLFKIWPLWIAGIVVWRVIVYSRRRKNN